MNWASGLSSGVDNIDGEWFTQSPVGRVRLVFAPSNDHGVLDHEVVTPTGEHFYNPMRVFPSGPENFEVIFSVRRWPGTTEAELARDAATVTADLVRLKEILESRP